MSRLFINLFKKVYARDNWVAMKIPYFPNKLDNLWGYSLRVGFNLEEYVFELSVFCIGITYL